MKVKKPWMEICMTELELKKCAPFEYSLLSPIMSLRSNAYQETVRDVRVVQAVARGAVRVEEGINAQIFLAVSCGQPVFPAYFCIFAVSLPSLKSPFTLLFQELKNVEKRSRPKDIQRNGWSKKNRQYCLT
jgi:hypothetical protein